jgi:hypothetical protein
VEDYPDRYVVTNIVFFIFTECTVAVSLLRKIKEAVAKSNDHKFSHHQFMLGLPADSAGRWEEQLSKWEEDHSKPNPFDNDLRYVCLPFVDCIILLTFSHTSCHSGCSM